MRLLINNISGHQASYDAECELERAIMKDGFVSLAKPTNKFIYIPLPFIFRMLRRLGVFFVTKTRKVYSSHPLSDEKHLFTVMMGLDINKYLPYGLTTAHNRSVYLFDAWPDRHEEIVQFVRFLKIDFLFVSGSQSAKELGLKLSTQRVHWVPEGINPNEYNQYSYKEKTIDVLALGRKYDLYHDLIVDHLQKNNVTYLYEKTRGEIIFPTRESFIEGIARSKISICVPSNITHPQRAGNVETMTIRYLQSIVSKCLIVGHAPKEMIDLFGYNPVVEIDMLHPIQQLDFILANYLDYIPLIEKNYEFVLQNHTWENRWSHIKEILSGNNKCSI